MNPFFGNIEELTENNTNFRQVLFTGQYCQLVVMSLKPGEEIGAEVHETVDQFFRVEEGEGKVVIGESEEHLVAEGDAFIVPAGTKHNVINVSQTHDLKLYTIYSPPNHPDGTVHATKAEAEAYEAAGHDSAGSSAGTGNQTATEPAGLSSSVSQTAVSMDANGNLTGGEPATATATNPTAASTEPAPGVVELPPDLKTTQDEV